MVAVPDAPVSHGRWLAHCCAAVMFDVQLYALAELTAANIDAATTVATMPARIVARRPFPALMVPPVWGSPLLSSIAPLLSLLLEHAERLRDLADQDPAAQLSADRAAREGRGVDRDHELHREPRHQGLLGRRHDRAPRGPRREPGRARRRAEQVDRVGHVLRLAGLGLMDVAEAHGAVDTRP